MTIRLGFYYRKTRARKVAKAAIEGAAIAGIVTLFAAPGRPYLLAAVLGAVAAGGTTALLVMYDARIRKGV
jgi:outer membrane lipoprotein SlyB